MIFKIFSFFKNKFEEKILKIRFKKKPIVYY